MIHLICMLFALLASVEPRTVTVTVHVKSGQTALAGVPLTIRDGYKDDYGLTDSNGVAVIVKPVSPHQKWLAVLPLPEPQRFAESREDWTVRRTSETALLRQHAYRHFYRVDLTADEQQYELNIDVNPGRRVRGRVISGSVPVRGASVVCGGWSRAARTTGDGQFSLDGVPRTAFNLYVSRGGYVSRIGVPAGSVELDLGDIPGPSEGVSTCAVSATITNLGELDKTLIRLSEGITLVSADGTRLIMLGTDEHPDDPTKDTTGGTPPQKIPLGEWYVAPLGFVSTPAQLRLVERVIAGTVPTAVPKIVATEGGVVELEFDAKAVEQAILAP